MDQNTPLDTLRDGRLKATIWENVNEKNETYHSVTLAKTYEDRNGNLQDSHSFSGGELLRIAKLADKGHDVILERQRELKMDREAQQQPVQENRPRRFQGRGQSQSQTRSQPGLER
ncbi:MAG: hypothetical protein NXH97_21090 [Rhodobacteraceae bacterium]|nr:hypothetical protein [Paracoccaceae bacterium]